MHPSKKEIKYRKQVQKILFTLVSHLGGFQHFWSGLAIKKFKDNLFIKREQRSILEPQKWFHQKWYGSIYRSSCCYRWDLQYEKACIKHTTRFHIILRREGLRQLLEFSIE